MDQTDRSKDILQKAIESVDIQIQTLQDLKKSLHDDFEKVVLSLFTCKGRVVVTGIGKSAIIAQKMVATLNSTGTPSLFLHAADAVHGDLGMVQQTDTVICISKSGNSPEIKVLIPLLKQRGIEVIGMTANKGSFLGMQSDKLLFTPVEKEACPNNLAPTSSTTAQLVIGDAVAISLIHLRQFTEKDFAKYHPGGALGKKLYLRLEDLLKEGSNPQVEATTLVQDVIIEISQKRMGAAIVKENNEIIGVITDGDLRRMLAQSGEWKSFLAKDIMSKNPKTMASNELAYDAFLTMEKHNITQIIVADDGAYKGMIHLHDILKEGIF